MKQQQGVCRLLRRAAQVGAVFVTPVLLVGLAGVVVVELFIADYNDVADRLREDNYERASPPSDWEIEDGKAAEAYERAFDDCRLWEMDEQQGVRAQLNAAYWVLVDAEPDEFAVTTEKVGDSCVEAGLDGTEGSSVRDYLTEDLCRELVACLPSLNLMREGTQRREARSLVALWRDQRKIVGPSIVLARAWLVAAALTSPASEAEVLAAVLRFGQDVSRGSSLPFAMTGFTLQFLATIRLGMRVGRGEYNARVMARLIREIDHVRQQPIDFAEALDAEMLQFTPALFHRSWLRGRLHAPPSISQVATPSNLYQEAVLFHFNFAIWSVRSELQAANGHQGRLAVYTRNIEQYDDSYEHFRMLMVSLLVSYRRHEVVAGATTEMLDIVYLALHARLHRLETGDWPRSVDDLATRGLPTTSPLTGRPFTVEVSNERLTISSDRTGVPPHALPKAEDDRYLSLPLR